MNLYLSNHSPIHSTFTGNDGQALYKVDTPMKVFGRTSTITRAVSEELLNLEDGVDMRDRFEFLAQIEYKAFASSIIKFEDTRVETRAYFQKEGWGPYGRPHAFTGPDGKRYKWFMNFFTSELILNDGSKTPVAQFHRRRVGILRKSQPAYLEIFPPGKRIVDTI
ncbi:hypothetical protein BDZ94DRAFT_1212195, partial [Collybia nuda]